MSGSVNATEGSSFLGPIYEKSTLVSILHSMPRFGRSDDVTLLITEEQSDTVEYTVGAAFATMVMSAFFLLWAFVILTFNCLGPRKVGFLAGGAMREAKASEDRDSHVRRPRRVRLAFILTGFILIGCVMALLFVGLPKLDEAATNFNESTMEANSLIDNGFALTRSLSNIATNTESLRDDLVIDLQVFCPNGNFSQVLQDLELQDVTAALTQVDDFSMNELESLKTTLNQARTGTVMVSDGVETYLEFKYFFVYWAPLCFFTVLLLCGTLLAWAKKSRAHVKCMLSYIVLPLFSIWIMGTILLAGALALSGVVNADSCSGGEAEGSPSGTMVAALNRLQTEDTSGGGMVVATLEYYAGGCRADSPVEFMDDFITRLDNALTASTGMITAINAFGTDGVSQLCGEDISLTTTALQTFYSNMQTLLADAKDAQQLLACDRLNPLYVQTFHESACQQSPVAALWIWGCLLGIAVCGMTMIMLRSSILPIRYLDPTAFGAAGRHYDDDLKLTESGGTSDARKLDINATGSESQFYDSRDEYDEYVQSMRQQGIEERRHVTLQQPYLPSDEPSQSESWDRSSYGQEAPTPRSEFGRINTNTQRDSMASSQMPLTPRHSDQDYMLETPPCGHSRDDQQPSPSPHHVIHRQNSVDAAPAQHQQPIRDQFLPDALPPPAYDPEPTAEWLSFHDENNNRNGNMDDTGSAIDSVADSVPHKETIIY